MFQCYWGQYHGDGEAHDIILYDDQCYYQSLKQSEKDDLASRVVLEVKALYQTIYFMHSDIYIVKGKIIDLLFMFKTKILNVIRNTLNLVISKGSFSEVFYQQQNTFGSLFEHEKVFFDAFFSSIDQIIKKIIYHMFCLQHQERHYFLFVSKLEYRFLETMYLQQAVCFDKKDNNISQLDFLKYQRFGIEMDQCEAKTLSIGKNQCIIEANDDEETVFYKEGCKAVIKDEVKLIDFEPLFYSNNYLVKIKEIIRYFFKRTKKQVNHYLLCVPNIKKERKVPFFVADEFMGFVHHKIALLPYLYAMVVILKQFKQYEFTVMIPSIRCPKDFHIARSMILWLCKLQNINMPKVGIILHTESVVEYIEAYHAADGIIIDLDELFLEIFNIQLGEFISEENFKKEMVLLLRDIHQTLRLKNIKHWIKGACLNQPVIYEKLLKMGFTRFIHAHDNQMAAQISVENYVSRRGKYQGIAQTRKKKC